MSGEENEMQEVGNWLGTIEKSCSQFDADINMSYIPYEGMEFESFESEQAAWDSYKEYARKTGFGIRIRYSNKCQKTGQLTSRKMCCIKEGVRGVDKRDYKTKRPRAETRCGCNAHMIISLNRETRKYKVFSFEAKHNHDLQLPECVHMIPTHRKISDAQATQVNMADDSGIRLKASHELMGRQVGGRDNLGFTKQDQKNYLRTKRKKSLQYGEAGSLLMYFRCQISENPSFVYEVQMDSEEQITNIFWADAKMVFDYGHFGDVVTFDTTFRTNKEYRPFGVFVGFNHYRETVIFGAALLYDETTASFQWLFETFLKTMRGKKPKTIFTDQDAAMAKAISLVMPDTYHGLCIWHIMQNALKHLGHLFKEGSDFSRRFNACIFDHENEEELLDHWKALLDDYDPLREGWLPSIFAVKEKWARTYMKNVFSAGMRSTQLSESLNADLRNYLKVDLDIMQFFTHFERVVEDKRYKEWEAEYNSRHKLPRLKMKKAPMLVHASERYTPKIFEEFQEEYEEYQGALIKEHTICTPDRDEYIVEIFGQDKDHKVVANNLEASLNCTCRKFETYGILCSHVLKVLDARNIKLIPEHYILRRWTRNARNGSVKDLHGRPIEIDPKSKFTDRYRDLCPKIVQLVNRASESHEAYTFLSKVYYESSKIVEQIMERNSNANDDGQFGIPHISYVLENERMEENLNDVREIKAKGLKKREDSYKGGKRLKSWSEKKTTRKNMSKKKRTMTQNVDTSGNLPKNIPLAYPNLQGISVPRTPTLVFDSGSNPTPNYTLTQLLTENLDYNLIASCNQIPNYSPTTI